MNRYTVHAQRSLHSPIVSFVVEASTWESAGKKAEQAWPIVTSVEPAENYDYGTEYHH